MSMQRNRLFQIIHLLDQPARWVGLVAAWLIFPLMGALVYEVVARYVFNSPTVWAYDITYMIYATMFMLGAAYALYRGSHVRADFFYNALSPRAQGLIDATLYLVLFFPSIAFFTWRTGEFALTSWMQGERITTSPWMPAIYPLKTVMPVTGVLLLIQGVSETLKSLYAVSTNTLYRSGGSGS